MKTNWKALLVVYIAGVVIVGLFLVLCIAGYYFPWTTVGVLLGLLGWLIYKLKKKDGKN